MPTSAKRLAPVTAKRAPKKTVEPVSKPFLRFHHSHELRVRTLEVLVTVENAEQATTHSEELTELVLELTDHGMRSVLPCNRSRQRRRTSWCSSLPPLGWLAYRR